MSWTLFSRWETGSERNNLQSTSMASTHLRFQISELHSSCKMLSPYFGQAHVCAEGTGAHLLAHFPMLGAATSCKSRSQITYCNPSLFSASISASRPTQSGLPALFLLLSLRLREPCSSNLGKYSAQWTCSDRITFTCPSCKSKLISKAQLQGVSQIVDFFLSCDPAVFKFCLCL